MGIIMTVQQVVCCMGIFAIVAQCEGSVCGDGNSPVRAAATWRGRGGGGGRGIPNAEDLARNAAKKLSDSPIKALSEGVPKAIELANLEQELENVNVMHKYDRRIERVLMVMPLTEQFDPPVGQFGQGHVQFSDRASIPRSVVMEVVRRKLDVPWQFEIARVHRRGGCVMVCNMHVRVIIKWAGLFLEYLGRI